MGREAEANLGVGGIAFGLAKFAHDYARERVLEVYHEKLPQRVVGPERFATPLLTLHAVEHRLGVARIRQGTPLADRSPRWRIRLSSSLV